MNQPGSVKPSDLSVTTKEKSLIGSLVGNLLPFFVETAFCTFNYCFCPRAACIEVKKKGEMKINASK